MRALDPKVQRRHVFIASHGREGGAPLLGPPQHLELRIPGLCLAHQLLGLLGEPIREQPDVAAVACLGGVPHHNASHFHKVRMQRRLPANDPHAPQHQADTTHLVEEASQPIDGHGRGVLRLDERGAIAPHARHIAREREVQGRVTERGRMVNRLSVAPVWHLFSSVSSGQFSIALPECAHRQA